MLRSADQSIARARLVQVPESRHDMLADFLSALFKLYIDLNFVYMEINPIVVVEGRITPLDMAAKIDETASFLCGPKWGEIDFPAPFGEKAVGLARLLFRCQPPASLRVLSRTARCSIPPLILLRVLMTTVFSGVA